MGRGSGREDRETVDGIEENYSTKFFITYRSFVIGL